ncbi:hypothetical protein BCR33DRAFT_770201 [Rhizoclosmatium globosum]|uniref:Crinkler effector protein N-terminal domain-containing protein n=1 Tax=Rhizoclosmatium globosum TaxID=329046 RepID=A0A1Y2BRH1_9FUNG|nr:hypothetical protein BCR33DRAFT_770201 [Rhizoclosmatium globosum]|eukprot:ORY36735.1 hypothetical protein BCR33DRAFT_770201 [Rhizoclosmatium globosum]
MSKIFCVLGTDTTLTGFPVYFDSSLTVSDLKDAIKAKASPELNYLAAASLVLVRLAKESVAGLTKKELKIENTPLNIEEYGEDPEGDNGGSKELFVNGFVFKTMNGLEAVAAYGAYFPPQHLHVLVVLPKKPTPVYDFSHLHSALNSISAPNSTNISQAQVYQWISPATAPYVTSLLRDLSLSVEKFNIVIQSVSKFEWSDEREDSPKNKRNYLRHLNGILGLQPPFSLYSGENQALKTEIMHRKFNGFIDCIISSSNSDCLGTCHIGIELFKPENKDKKIRQAQLELIALDLKSRFNVMVVVTDLNERWTFYWLQNRDQRKELCSSDNLNRDQAVNFIKLRLQNINLNRTPNGTLTEGNDSLAEYALQIQNAENPLPFKTAKLFHTESSRRNHSRGS